MDYAEFIREYPELTHKDYVALEVKMYTPNEVRENLGIGESEFKGLYASFVEANAENFDLEEDYHFSSHAPKRLYAVEVLSVGPVPREALKRFASLYPERFAEGRFWLPPADRIYRSLSGAKSRAALLRFNGVECRVVECTPGWVPYETKTERMERLEAENAELRERLEEVA